MSPPEGRWALSAATLSRPAPLHCWAEVSPTATLVVNVAGSFLLGALVELLALAWSPPHEVRIFLVSGFLGAFTTFSAFSLDVITQFERSNNTLAVLYVVASVALSVLALVAGLRLMRLVLA